MIKLMIVDDEAVIRQGLRKAVDWEDHGVTIVAEAKDGRSALEKAVQHQPDIVISDIRMAEGDGISLAEKLLEMQPRTRIIMLSGYSDIEYMMEAIKLGVRDYMLKPAGSEQILESVIKLRDDILHEQAEARKNTYLESLMNENLEMLRRHFLAELLYGGVPAREVPEKAAELSLALGGPLYQLVVAAPRPERAWEVVQAFSSRFDAWAPVLADPDGLVVAILNVEGPLPREALVEAAQQIAPAADPLRRPCAGVPCGLEDLPAQYAACRERMERAIWLPGPVLDTGAVPPARPVPEEQLLALERNIVQEVRMGGTAELNRQVDALFALLAEYQPPAGEFREIVLGVARSIQVFSENNDISCTLDELFQANSAPQAIHEAFGRAVSNDFTSYGPQVAGALAYIQEHCASELSLPEVAAALYISPSYLTRLLKNKTQRGFNDWLHKMRIDKARELLVKSDLRHYEIAEQVGYRSYKIFSEYFSKIVGCSAKAYREENPRKAVE